MSWSFAISVRTLSISIPSLLLVHTNLCQSLTASFSDLRILSWYTFVSAWTVLFSSSKTSTLQVIRDMLSLSFLWFILYPCNRSRQLEFCWYSNLFAWRRFMFSSSNWANLASNIGPRTSFWSRYGRCLKASGGGITVELVEDNDANFGAATLSSTAGDGIDGGDRSSCALSGGGNRFCNLACRGRDGNGFSHTVLESKLSSFAAILSKKPKNAIDPLYNAYPIA